ncbi:MAG TPA: DUF3592 domain-containing protein [Pseudobdellovibrionaceae bacterium]|nr:DUF3592 domain-containing protein [Pseudobdellovibrionaceae bacterium]
MRTERQIGTIFSVVGAAILTGGLVWSANSLQFTMVAIDVEGTVVSQQTETCTRSSDSGSSSHRTTYTCYRAIVEYQINSTTHSSPLPYTTSSPYTPGEKLQLKVDPAQPKEASTSGALWLGPLFLTLFGSVFATVGGFILRSVIRKQRILDQLQHSPHRVRGLVTYVGPNYSIKVNRRHPWIVKADWVHPSTGQTHTATTFDELWSDPQTSGQIEADGTVEVRFDPKDPTRAAIFLRVATAQRAG